MESIDADHLGIFKIALKSDLYQHLRSFFAKVHRWRMELGLQTLRTGMKVVI